MSFLCVSLDLAFCVSNSSFDRFITVLLAFVVLSTKPRSLGRTCLKWLVLCQLGRKALTQSMLWYVVNALRSLDETRADEVADAGRFETDVISVRLGRPVSREELLSEQSTATDSAKCSAAAAAQWKFLCIEGYIRKLMYNCASYWHRNAKYAFRCQHELKLIR